MLFNVTAAPAPVFSAPVSKSKSVLIVVQRVDRSALTPFDPWFEEFVVYRYASSGDAAAHTSPTEVSRGSQPRHMDNQELTRGSRYWYRVGYLDIFGNLSVLAAAQSVVYRGVSGADSNLTDPNSYAENSDFSLGPDIGWSDPTRIISDVANAFRGTYVAKRAYAGAASSYVNRNMLLFAVRPGEQYLVGGMVKNDGSFAHSGGNFGGWRLSYCSDALGVTEIATSAVAGPAALTTAWGEYSALVTVPATSTIAYARLEPAVYGQTAGTVFFSHGYVRPAVTEVMADKTPPVAPAAAPTMTVLTADFDKDGKSEQGFFMNLPTWASGVAVKYWEVEHQEATAQGSSGSMTGYSKRLKNETIKAEPSGNTYYQYEAKATRWHKTRYRGISFSGKEGAWSAYQNLGAQPNIYDATTGTTPATPTAIALDNGIEVAWIRPAIANYSHTELYQGVTLIYTGSATKWLDKTARTPGVGYTYTIKHYDRAGNVSNSSAASASVNYRQIETAQIAPRAVVLTQLKNPASKNMLLDENMEDKDFWGFRRYTLAGGAGTIADIPTGQIAILDNPASPTFRGYSQFLFQITASTNTDVLVFESDLVPVKRGYRYIFECYVDKVSVFLAATTNALYVEFDTYKVDSGGVPVFVSTSAAMSVIKFGTGVKVLNAMTPKVSAQAYIVARVVMTPDAANTVLPIVNVASMLIEETAQPNEDSAISFNSSGFIDQTFGNVTQTIAIIGAGTPGSNVNLLDPKDPSERSTFQYFVEFKNASANNRDYTLRFSCVQYDPVAGTPTVVNVIHTRGSIAVRAGDTFVGAFMVANVLLTAVEFYGYFLDVTPSGNANDLRNIKFHIIEFRQ